MEKEVHVKIFCLIIIILLLLQIPAYAQFELSALSGRIMTLVDTSNGERQNIILSQKGMVVINSFWSGITAEKFRKEWARQLKRDDFIYNINTVDRLDLFGGNSAYKDICIIGHESFLNKFKQPQVDAEIERLIKMWRWKEDVSRKRLPTHEPGSEAEIIEKRWLRTCKNRADELEQGFSLVLPTKVYDDTMVLELGDLHLHLFYFGKAGYDGMTLILIPEEETVFIPGFIFHSHHLAPAVNYEMNTLDVERWIYVLNRVLNEDYPVSRVIGGMGEVWTRERALVHLNYIETLWNRVEVLEKQGKTLQAIQDICSLENEFSFVKEMKTYIDHGDEWTRPQHMSHVRAFFLQHKKLASTLIKEEAENTSVASAISKIVNMGEKDKSIYFGEPSLNTYGYALLNAGRTQESIMIFKLIVNMFPESANAYDSLGEAYMKNGQNSAAVENYEKSLMLNPENTNAKDQLIKLKNE